jgi:hypothetical protein
MSLKVHRFDSDLHTPSNAAGPSIARLGYPTGVGAAVFAFADRMLRHQFAAHLADAGFNKFKSEQNSY